LAVFAFLAGVAVVWAAAVGGAEGATLPSALALSSVNQSSPVGLVSVVRFVNIGVHESVSRYDVRRQPGESIESIGVTVKFRRTGGML